MSVRLMKKILKEQEEEAVPQQLNSDDESESSPPPSATFRNPFDLLDEEEEDTVDQTILVCPLENWPRWDGSLSMELVETRDGICFFRYVHTPSYTQAQKAFESAKAVHDFNGIVNILMHHPYHVDSLITLADYYKFSGEHQMSADCTARCLYALECAWDAAHSVIKTLQNDGNDARDWTCVTKEAFSSEKNEYSHLLVSDFSDSVPTLPPDNLPNFMVDPRGEVPNDAQLANHRVQDLSDRNAIAVLLESMLPWINYGSGHDQPDHDEQANEG
ncbi:unnamed protein product [Withania somnifera]